MKNRKLNEDSFSAKFRVSTRRLPAAARSRAVAHRGRADRQEQRRNHPKEPLKIKLTFGKVAIVDAEDYDRVSMYNWCAVHDSRCWYAHTFKRDGTPLAMHRLILNAPKGLFIDHIDHNGLNNRKSNLRLCTNRQNQQNRRPTRNGSSRYKGVHWCNTHKKFRARITHNSKRIHLGYFEDEIAAAKAYDKKAKELFGEFAYLNFPAESSEVQRSKGKRTPNIEHRTPNIECGTASRAVFSRFLRFGRNDTAILARDFALLARPQVRAEHRRTVVRRASATGREHRQRAKEPLKKGSP